MYLCKLFTIAPSITPNLLECIVNEPGSPAGSDKENKESAGCNENDMEPEEKEELEGEVQLVATCIIPTP
jgi:hypothetical protein